MEIYERQKDMPKQFGEDKNTELDFCVEKGRWHEIRGYCNLDEAEFIISLSKLAKASLIKEIVGMYVNYHGGHYLITPAFRKLMNFIQSGSNEPLFYYHIARSSS
jgi:hypothetical protein